MYLTRLWKNWNFTLMSTLPYSFTRLCGFLTSTLLGSLCDKIDNYPEIFAKSPSTELAQEFDTYYKLQYIPVQLDLPTRAKFWKSMGERFPLLSLVAQDVIWMPMSGVDVERSFSKYKHILNDRRENLTDHETLVLYHNSDVEGRFQRYSMD